MAASDHAPTDQFVDAVRAAIDASVDPIDEVGAFTGYLADYAPNTKTCQRDAIVAATRAPSFLLSLADPNGQPCDLVSDAVLSSEPLLQST